MKKLLYALALLPALVFGQVANDLIWTQRKSDNSGNIQRNVSPTANAALGVDANKLPLALTAFTQDSVTGAAAVTAGGTNQNVTLTPSGTGWVNVGSVTGASGVVVPMLQVAKEASGSSIFPSLELVGYQNGQTAQIFNVIAKAGGTAASPSNASANATVGGFRFYAYANGAFRSVGNWSVGTNSTFGNSDFSTNMVIGPSSTGATFNMLDMRGGSSSTGQGSGINFGPGTGSATSVDKTFFNFDSNNATRTSAWGTSGANLAIIARTYTDAASSGTVSATTVFNSFGVPALNSTSSVTYSGILANLYIAGDPTVTGNATLTGTSYGLYNVGKTRLDGALTVNASGTFNLNSSALPSATFGGVQIGGVDATGVAFTATTFANDPQFIGRRYGGTNASKTATPTQSTLLRLRAEGYDGTNATGNVGGFRVVSNQAFTSGAQGTYLAFSVVPDGSTTLGDALYIGNTDGLGSQWTGVLATRISGGAGNMTITAGTGASRTLTLQTTTSGSTATNALVLSATQSATFNGPIIQKVSALTYASPTSVDVTLGNVYTVTTVNATGSVTFNASAGGTSGQRMTIIITNDATSAKTITFGTNFVANGTLTPSGANKVATIEFMSNGTNFYETCRTVLP